MRVNLLRVWAILICFYIGKSDFVGKLKITGNFSRLNYEAMCLGTVDEITKMAQALRCGRFAYNAEESVNIWFQGDEVRFSIKYIGPL